VHAAAYSSVAAASALSHNTQFPYTFPIVKETMSYKLNWEILALLFRGIATINTEKPLYQPTTIDLLKTLHFCVWALALSAAPSMELLLFCLCTTIHRGSVVAAALLSFIITHQQRTQHQLIQVPYCKFSIQVLFSCCIIDFRRLSLGLFIDSVLLLLLIMLFGETNVYEYIRVFRGSERAVI
jgi:hypothetical protein